MLTQGRCWSKVKHAFNTQVLKVGSLAIDDPKKSQQWGFFVG